MRGWDVEERVLIVAEIGNNHEGDAGRAADMVRAAAEAGADAVKLQALRAGRLVSAPATDPDRMRRLQGFELSVDEHLELGELAHGLGVLYLTTPLDVEGVETFAPAVDAFKVASGDRDFLALLDRVAGSGKPVILSTGLSTLDEVGTSVEWLERAGLDTGPDGDLALLHCVSAYPVPDEQANLRAVGALAGVFQCPVGYSDHTLGTTACVGAVAVGARIVEKHFTLDKHLSDFRDHQLSADPAEMAALVREIRRMELLLGHGSKEVQPCEEGLLVPARRSVAAARDLPEGTELGAADLTWLRPRTGLAPGREDALVGRRTRRALAAGEILDGSEVR